MERPRGQGHFFPLLTSYGSGGPICPAFVRGPCAAGLDDVRNETGPYKSTHRGGSRALVPSLQTTNLGVGSSNLSGRASDFNSLWARRRSNFKIKTAFRTANFFCASPSGRALARRAAPGAAPSPPTNYGHDLPARLRPSGVTIPDAMRRSRRKRRASGRSHSVPRPACGGAMLTLLRVRRAARRRRRPNLVGASRPLRRAGSWQPSFQPNSRG